MILTILCLFRASITVIHILLVSSFISSRPPGRKMVRNWLSFDIIIIANFSGDIWYQPLCSLLLWFWYSSDVLGIIYVFYLWTSSTSVDLHFPPNVCHFYHSLDWCHQCFVFHRSCYHNKSIVNQNITSYVFSFLYLG